MMNAADEWTWEVANWVSSAFLFSIRVPPVIQKKLTLALVLEDLSANKTQLRQTQRKTESPTKSIWHVSNLKKVMNVHGSTRNQS
jgi:hypothetical protein